MHSTLALRNQKENKGKVTHPTIAQTNKQTYMHTVHRTCIQTHFCFLVHLVEREAGGFVHLIERVAGDLVGVCVGHWETLLPLARPCVGRTRLTLHMCIIHVAAQLDSAL